MLVACGLWLDDEAKIERARIALENQEYSAAIIDMKSVLLNSPGNAEARELLGRALAANGEYEAADKHLQQALDQGRSLSDFRVALAETRLATGQPELALAIADPAATADNGVSFTLWLYRGDAQYELGEIVEALRSYEQAEALSVDNSTARLRAAEVFWYEGNLSDAKALTEFVLQEDPGNLDAHLTLGNILLEMQALSEARDQLTHTHSTLRLDPISEGYVLAALAETHLALGDVAAARAAADRVAELWTADDSDYRLLNARIALAEGDSKVAVTELLAYLVDFPDSEVAIRNLGAAQLQQGLLEQARLQLDRALAANPYRVDTRRLLARTSLALGDVDRAREVLEPALYLDARDPIVLSLLGLLSLPDDAKPRSNDADTAVRNQLIDGNIGEALATARQVVRDRPNDARALSLFGLSQLANGQARIAMESFTAALAAEPDNQQVRLNLARAYLAIGTPAEGLRALEAIGKTEMNTDASVTRRALVIQLHNSTSTTNTSGLAPLSRWLTEYPDDVDVRLRLAQTLLGNGFFADAAPHYELLIEQGIEASAVYNNLAWCYLQLGDDKALEHAEYAYELAPNDGAIVDTLGWILVSQGELERGRSMLRNAHTLRPGDAEIAYHFAYALSRSGAENEAIAILEGLLHRSDEAGQESARELLLQLRQRR